MKKPDYDINDSIELKMPIINAEFERKWEKLQKGRMKGSKYLAKKFFLSGWYEGMWAQFEAQRSGKNLTKTQEEALRKIKFLATDKRIRVLKDDHIEWLKTKMKEINKQAKKISKVKPWKP